MLPFCVFFLGTLKRVLLHLLASIPSLQNDVNRILPLSSCFTDNQDGGFVIIWGLDLCKEKATPVRSPNSAKHNISWCLARQILGVVITPLLLLWQIRSALQVPN